MNTQIEVWEPVSGLEDYLISNKGQVASIKKSDRKILKPCLSTSGHYCVNLWKSNVCNRKYIHRLVCEHFLKKDPDRAYVNHKNGIKTDNNIENLEWVTNRENSIHSSLLKKYASKYPGVYYISKGKKRWAARIRHKNERHFLGYYQTEELAYGAYLTYCNTNNIINKYNAVK